MMNRNQMLVPIAIATTKMPYISNDQNKKEP